MNKRKFPWKYALLNGVVLFGVLFADVLIRTPIAEGESVMGTFGALIFMFMLTVPVLVFLVLASLAYQSLVHKLFRRFVRNRIFWLPVFLLPAALIAGGQIYSMLPAKRIDPNIANAFRQKGYNNLICMMF